ncbi:MAG: hypothetical protein QGG40_00500 [Myxococcota bacterium]|nr:hypothetical protein [Myxococcota bacterium]
MSVKDTLVILASMVVLGPGCGPSTEKYPVEHAEATCQLYEDCEVLPALDLDYASCTEDLTGTYTSDVEDCASYSRSAATDCVDGILAMTCNDLLDEAWPTACSSICED